MVQPVIVQEWDQLSEEEGLLRYSPQPGTIRHVEHRTTVQHSPAVCSHHEEFKILRLHGEGIQQIVGAIMYV